MPAKYVDFIVALNVKDKFFQTNAIQYCKQMPAKKVDIIDSKQT